MTVKQKKLLEDYSNLLQKKKKIQALLREYYEHPRTYKLEIQKKERSLQKVKDAISQLKPLVSQPTEKPKEKKVESKREVKSNTILDTDSLIKAINRVKETDLIEYMNHCDDIICKFLDCDTDEELGKVYNHYKEIYLDYWIQSGLLEYLRNDKDYILTNLQDRPVLVRLITDEV